MVEKCDAFIRTGHGSSESCILLKSHEGWHQGSPWPHGAYMKWLPEQVITVNPETEPPCTGWGNCPAKTHETGCWSVKSSEYEECLNWLVDLGVSRRTAEMSLAWTRPPHPARPVVTAEQADTAWRNSWDTALPSQIGRTFLAFLGIEIITEAPHD